MEHKLQDFWLHNLFHHIVIFSLFGSNILLSTLLLETLSVRYQVLHYLRTSYLFVPLCILMVTVLGMKEDKSF
jgi:hypothetical protein